MKTLSYTESRARYAEVLDSVVNDREEIVITRAGHEPVVVMSLADFESLRETAYLMRSPANARRLLDAMERLEAGEGNSTIWSTPTDDAVGLGSQRLGGLSLVAGPGPQGVEACQRVDPRHPAQRQ